MQNPEQKRETAFFANLTVENELIITSPSKYKSTGGLKSLVAAQMLAGRREIIIEEHDKKAILIPEKTLRYALNLPLDELQIFLKVLTDKMCESEKVIFREIPRFSLN
ncbi:MAG: hypothetical protein Q7K11_01510 [Candidatus Berkelbacteria bacterium]|nr:hypothetical protein [Candidatus Berkelbacteria bacterium]